MNAVQAGFGDPRFAPLGEDELDGLELDVSILSHPRPIPARSEAELVEALEPDRDGLILGVGRRRALFLPSVWRQVADGREFVRHLLRKAGLDPMTFPSRPRRPPLPGRGVRRAVQAGERGGDRADAHRGGGRAIKARSAAETNGAARARPDRSPPAAL